jgi:hypothetical protein
MTNNKQFPLRKPRGTFIADPANPYNHAEINDRALAGDAGLVVRDPRLDDVVICLNAVIDELREIKMHLNLLTDFES